MRGLEILSFNKQELGVALNQFLYSYYMWLVELLAPLYYLFLTPYPFPHLEALFGHFC